MKNIVTSNVVFSSEKDALNCETPVMFCCKVFNAVVNCDSASTDSHNETKFHFMSDYVNKHCICQVSRHMPRHKRYLAPILHHK